MIGILGVRPSLGKWGLKGETLPILDSKGSAAFICPGSLGWTTTNVGSGGSGGWAQYGAVYTGVTANSSALRRQSLMSFSKDQNFDTGFNWAKKLYITLGIARYNSDAQAVARIQIKQESAIGALGNRGIGLQMDNYALYLESYESALGKLDLSTTLTDRKTALITLVLNPNVPNLKCYVNGVLKGTQTDATKIPTSISAAFIFQSIKNGAAGGVDAFLYFSNTRVWQET